MTEEQWAKIPQHNEVIEEMQGEVMDEKEKFLSKLQPEMRVIVEQRLKKKEREKKENKETAKRLADITREMLEEDYIKLDDTSITVGELLVSKAMFNALSNPKTSFRDLNDAQKVVDNDVSDNRNGFTLILNTNGQDLGA